MRPVMPYVETMQAMVAHFANFVGPPRPPRPATYERPEYHYDHVFHWSNGTLTESIEWVPRQDWLAAAWAAERHRNHFDH